MTELDLGLKVGVRQLFWSMGFTTRLDVQLRGFSPPGVAAKRAPAPESFTDLDVLGIAIAAGYQVHSAIADCKTSARDSTSRMFWVRGAADMYGADQAYMVREREVTDAARQLSARLKITVLTPDDLTRMQDMHGSLTIDPAGPLVLLFDRKAVSEHLAAFNGLDRRLKRLLDYRQFDYWVYEEHRNPVQLVAHLAGASKILAPRDPVHMALFLDLAWLYLLSLIRVTVHLRGAFLGDPDRGLQEYLFGGALGLQEKRNAADLLNTYSPEGTQPLSYLPPYYAHLRELTTRLLRRPGHMQEALRYAEAATTLAAARSTAPISSAFGDRFDPVAAKLVADVCGFLVLSADLDGGFRSRARGFLLGEPVPADEKSGKKPAAAITAPKEDRKKPREQEAVVQVEPEGGEEGSGAQEKLPMSSADVTVHDEEPLPSEPVGVSSTTSAT